MHDQEIALKPAPTVTSAPSASEENKTDEVRQYFLKLAGEDLEVDWEELKDVLDFATKTELQVNKVSVRDVEAGIGINSGGYNITNALVGFFCIPLCKTTPINEIVPSAVPASTVAVAPTSKLNETKNRGFTKDVCKSIVALLDVDRSGKLGFEEFKMLWGVIAKSKQAFQTFDKDHSGALSGFELRQALNSVGYALNNNILNILMHRYGNKKAEIAFDDFVLCGIKLTSMIDVFQRKNKGVGATSISLTFDDWMETTLYS